MLKRIGEKDPLKYIQLINKKIQLEVCITWLSQEKEQRAKITPIFYRI